MVFSYDVFVLVTKLYRPHKNNLVNVPSSILWNNFCKINVISSLNIFFLEENLPRKPSGLEFSLWESFQLQLHFFGQIYGSSDFLFFMSVLISYILKGMCPFNLKSKNMT